MKHVSFHFHGSDSLTKNLEIIMTTVAELAKTIGDVDTRLTKAKDEILAKIQELQNSVVNLNLPPEVEAALDNLKAQAQALDDIVPDVTP